MLLSPADLWAQAQRRDRQPPKSLWTRIAFRDETPDFVPPPPRDALDEGEFNEGQEIDGRGESDLANVPGAEPLFDRGTEDIGPTLADEEAGLSREEEGPADGNLDLLPPQREYFDPGFNSDPHANNTWQVMPSGLMYRSYLAGEKEPRIASVWMKDRTGRTVWESTLGARVGLLRYGTVGAYRPQGWQFDIEGGSMTRVLPGTPSSMLEAVDFRVGLISTWATGRWHVKAGYYHLSSHLGDEFIIANPGYARLNYVRDSAITGVTYDLTDNWQTYGEIAYALGAEDGAKPLEFQYGIQYSPLAFGARGAPFAAVNTHVRQDFHWITSLNCQAGWQWRGTESQRLLRAGIQYYNGPSLQYSFAGRYDTLFGGGLWIDF